MHLCCKFLFLSSKWRLGNKAFSASVKNLLSSPVSAAVFPFPSWRKKPSARSVTGWLKEWTKLQVHSHYKFTLRMNIQFEMKTSVWKENLTTEGFTTSRDLWHLFRVDPAFFVSPWIAWSLAIIGLVPKLEISITGAVNCWPSEWSCEKSSEIQK